MSGLYHAHSGLRFLILALGLVAVALCALGASGGKPFSKGARIVCSAFAGLLHLQVLIGIALVVGGLWQPRDYGHVTMMVGAALLAQLMLSKNRRAAQPGWALPLIGVGGALVLIVGGIIAIGRMPWGSTAFG